MSLSTWLMFGILILLYILCLVAKRLSFSKKYRGNIGEALTEEVLERFEKYNYDIYGKTLRNVYIPKSETETTEIDVMYITARGIFVLESKNYSGWIFGRENDSYWTATLPAGMGRSIKNKFYNPLKQNENHIRYLREYLKQYFPNKDFKIFSIIVFSDRCELKSIPETSNHFIIQRSELFKTVKDILEKEELSLTNVQVDDIHIYLERLTQVDYEKKKAHIENIRSQYLSKSEEENRICPICGNKLVIRTAKRGERAGKKFYGCSAYPQCGYIKNID